MNKEDLMKFLQDNLKIRIKDESLHSYYATSITHTFQLILDKEVISEDYITIPCCKDD